MAISKTYGMGVYNSRSPTADIRLPSTAGGIATPLAFFPSTQIGTVDEAIDTSLQDLIAANSGSSSNLSSGNTNSKQYGSNSDLESIGSVGSVNSFKLEGLGAGKLVSSAAGAGISTLAASSGAPGTLASALGALGKGLVGEGLKGQDIANYAVGTIATSVLGVPALAMAALNLAGFNPAQGVSEMLGISTTTPGFEGGFFGKQGIGEGISYDPSAEFDTGIGLSQDSTAGLSGGGLSFNFPGLSYSVTDAANESSSVSYSSDSSDSSDSSSSSS